MKSTNHRFKGIKHALLVVCGFLFVFALLYSQFIGQSGGDIGLVLFTVLFLVVYTLAIGVLTYSWEFKEKIGVILGLLASCILAYVFSRFWSTNT